MVVVFKVIERVDMNKKIFKRSRKIEEKRWRGMKLYYV